VIARLGIAGRLLAIGVLGFGALLVLLGGLLYLLRAQETVLERRFPLPAQIAAIVETIDHAPSDQRAALLTALDSPALSVKVDPGGPEVDNANRQLPRLENFLGRFDPDLAGREVVVDIPDASGRPLLDAWRGVAPVRVQIALSDGSHLSITARGEPVRRWLGLPSGFWLAVTGILQGWFGILQGGFWLNALAVGLAMFAVAAFVVGMNALFGRVGIAIGAVLTVLVGNPLSAAAQPLQFLVGPWGAVGQWFVPGASVTLLRDLSYFPAADALFPWLVLVGWAAVGVVGMLAGHFRDQEVTEAAA